MILIRKHINKIFTGLIFGLFPCIWFSCIEDKGNYDYHDVNSITISGIASSYSVPMGQVLKITPTLTFSVSETLDSCKYEWHVLDNLGSNQSSIGKLSSEKNLDIIVGDPITTDGSYRIMYCVTNLTTGVRYDYIFMLNVRSRMQIGYILLCERENNSFDIDLISIYNDTLTQYHNVLDLYHSQLPRTDRKPLDLVCHCDPASPILTPDGKKKYAIWILTDKGTDRVRVEDFEWKPEFNISGISSVPEKYLQGEKLTAEKMAAPVVDMATEGTNWIYLKGNWFWYNWAPNTYFYLSPINVSSSAGNAPYKAAPYIFARSQHVAVLFNEDANRFEYQDASSTGTASSALSTKRLGTNETYFNWENPNYRLIYMDNRDTYQGFAVVKNTASSKYELLLMDVRGQYQPPRKLGQAEFPTGLALEDIKFYAFHGSLPYLFCATEDKLYRINTSAMQQWDDITSSVLPAGHKISRVRSSGFRFPGNGGRVIVATYDPSGQAGKNGQLAVYNVEDGMGNLNQATHSGAQTPNNELKWTGFGKIINVDYKDPK